MAGWWVTGAAGFIGSHLVDRLLNENHSVLGIDDLSRGSRKNLEKSIENANFDLIVRDLRNPGLSERLLQRHGVPDVIVHLAAINGTQWFHDRADDVIDVNLGCTKAVLELSNKYSIRLVYASSPEAFGLATGHSSLPHEASLFENPSRHGRHSYGVAKHLDEIRIQHLVRSSNLDARIIRPHNAYGPRQIDDAGGQVVGIFLRAALRGDPLPIHAPGTQTRAFTWIGDVINAFILAGNLDIGKDGTSLSGCALDITSEDEISIQKLASSLIRIAKGSVDPTLRNTEIVEGHPGDVPRRRGDASSATAKLGWKAETSLEEGLKLCVSAYNH